METKGNQNHLLNENVPDLAPLLGKEAIMVSTLMKGRNQEVTIAPLRQIEYWCKRYLTYSTDSSDQFVMFFMATFIHDVFFNLSGDMLYNEKTEKYKKQYFSTRANQIAEVGEILVSGRRNELLSVFYAIVATYMNTIKQINQISIRNEGAENGRDVKSKKDD